VNARTAERVVEAALERGLGANYRERVLPGVQERLAPEIDWRRILLPFPMSHPEVERVRDIEYWREGGRPIRLDVYRRKDRPRTVPRSSRSTAAPGSSAARTSRASRSCWSSRRAGGSASTPTIA
jgi:hypothetical protein